MVDREGIVPMFQGGMVDLNTEEYQKAALRWIDQKNT
jgi:hypothetical protein